jgi:hypothetical protein
VQTLVEGSLPSRAVDAYGGEARWRAATGVDALISMGGFLLKLKGHPPESLRELHTHTEIERPLVRVEPIDSAGNVGVLDGHTLRLERPNGDIVEERPDARRFFPYKGRRLVRWDRLDALYFVAYTQWTYNAFPTLLWRDDVTWREVGDGVLEARFPPHLPTHSEVQRFYFDRDTHLLTRMDYTAEVFGGWAKAAHIVEAHGESGGIPYPSRRRVWSRDPKGRPRTTRSPLMILLDVHEWQLV